MHKEHAGLRTLHGSRGVGRGPRGKQGPPGGLEKPQEGEGKACGT